MTERKTKRFKIVASLVVVVILIFGLISFSSHSDYNHNDHLMEQGEKPVYVTPPVVDVPKETITENQGSSNETQSTENKQENMSESLDIDRSLYEAVDYDAITHYCDRGDPLKVKMEGVVYSVVELSDTVVYKIADVDGSLYSVVASLNNGLLKLKTADKVVIYGCTKDFASLNNTKIPQLEAHLFERVE